MDHVPGGRRRPVLSAYVDVRSIRVYHVRSESADPGSVSTLTDTIYPKSPLPPPPPLTWVLGRGV